MNTDVIKILLVEDSPSDADLLQEMLRNNTQLHYECVLVTCLEDALAYLRGASCDVLLLDLSLPDSSGPATYQRVRQAMPRIPIIVLTVITDEAISLEAIRHGIQDYLVKDQSDGFQIARAIRYAIERKRVEEAQRQQYEELSLAKEALKRLHDELEARVFARTSDLARAHEALQHEMHTRVLAEARQLAAVMGERNRIAQEIHDTLAQGLAGIIIQLETADYQLERDTAAARTCLLQARALARESLSEARRSVMALRPAALEKDDLVTVLKDLVEKLSTASPIEITFSHQGIPYPLSPDMEHDLLRLCQEAVTNACKHAHAQHIRATLIFSEEQVALRIEDDGQGFDLSQRSRSNSFGLRIMKERVANMDGRFVLTSQAGQGTCVVVETPRNSERQGTYADDKIAENSYCG